jgi:hypothetical protein
MSFLTKLFGCQHIWKLKGAIYNPPINEAIACQAQSYVFLRQIHGYTNITLVCSKCEQLKIREEIGQIHVPT